MSSDQRLDEARWATMESVARACASSPLTETRPDFGWHQRRDAALDGITEYVHERGYPPGSLQSLYAAGSGEIRRQMDQALKHRRWGSFWIPSRGIHDQIAEDITDRIGIHQLTWALTPGEWEAVAAEAERIRRDEDRAYAAALIGISPVAYTQRLMSARRRARALWISPGDTPPARYTPLARQKAAAPGQRTARALRCRRANQTDERRERDREQKRAQRAARRNQQEAS